VVQCEMSDMEEPSSSDAEVRNGTEVDPMVVDKADGTTSES
jgi:hypothetical protein